MDTGGVSGERIKSYVDRISRVEDERDWLAADILELYAAAKGDGFDTKTLRNIVRLTRMDEQKRREADEMLELYKAAVGLD